MEELQIESQIEPQTESQYTEFTSNNYDEIIKYQAFQSVSDCIIIFLLACILGSSIIRGFWSR